MCHFLTIGTLYCMNDLLGSLGFKMSPGRKTMDFMIWQIRTEFLFRYLQFNLLEMADYIARIFLGIFFYHFYQTPYLKIIFWLHNTTYLWFSQQAAFSLAGHLLISVADDCPGTICISSILTESIMVSRVKDSRRECITWHVEYFEQGQYAQAIGYDLWVYLNTAFE